ncbi:MAG: hypothetical protein QXN87_02720 [Candidatus Bathyarchaeia archaeon]
MLSRLKGKLLTLFFVFGFRDAKNGVCFVFFWLRYLENYIPRLQSCSDAF